MTMEGDLLAEGKVATTEGAIYTAPASSIIFVKFISFHNTNVAIQTLYLYIRKGAGTSRIIARWLLFADETGYFEGSLALQDGDTIRAVTTTTNAVDYVITGVVQS